MNAVYNRAMRMWRRARREELIAIRMSIAVQDRKHYNQLIEERIYPLLVESGAGSVSLYWPFKGEFNCRELMHKLDADGVQVLLPDAVEPKAPLVFRPWHPDMPMRRGV